MRQKEVVSATSAFPFVAPMLAFGDLGELGALLILNMAFTEALSPSLVPGRAMGRATEAEPAFSP